MQVAAAEAELGCRAAVVKCDRQHTPPEGWDNGPQQGTGKAAATGAVVGKFVTRLVKSVKRAAAGMGSEAVKLQPH